LTESLLTNIGVLVFLTILYLQLLHYGQHSSQIQPKGLISHR